MKDIMKYNTYLMGLAAAAGVLAVQQSQAVNLNFGNVPNGLISFGGGDFSFIPDGSGNAFKITGSDGVADSIGDQGMILGTFHIGNVTVNGGDQIAPVTGSGMINVSDGVNNFTATVNWIDIHSQGTAGSLNINGLVNLTSLAYAGGQQDLIDLAAPAVGYAVVSWTFTPGKTVSQLKAATSANPITTSFSGNLISYVSVPDSGTTLMLLGSSLAGLAFFGRFRKAALKA